MPVKTYTLKSPSGLSAKVSNLGATLRSLNIPDRHGKFENILIGCETDEDWLENELYFGSTVGRYANRIAKGNFKLNDTTHNLAKNDGKNHLHGGDRGFHKVIWDTKFVGESVVKFTHLSVDGEEGYPGNLSAEIEFSISDSGLTWKATATTDKATPVNLTSHGYFNLSGQATGSVLSHILNINAEKYLPVDETQIPTGEMSDVSGTGFDFRTPTPIGKNLKLLQGCYDHNYILDAAANGNAKVADPESGRSMVITTDQPGLQFYLSSPHGNKHSALCLEPQKFPDSPNRAEFPSAILLPDGIYSHVIKYDFHQS